MSFIKLQTESLEQLLPLLISQLPQTVMMVNIMKLKVNNKYPEGDQVDIYSFNHDHSEENLFIVIILKQKLQEEPFVVIHSPETVTDEMLHEFRKLFDWSKIIGFEPVSTSFAHRLESVVKAEGGTISKNPCTILHLPIDDALKLDLNLDNLGQNYEIDKLSPEHASIIKSNWRYGDEYHLLTISDCITFGSAGVFKKEPHNPHPPHSSDKPQKNNSLLSWVILSHHGTLSALHTLEQHRGKGLAKITMKAASKFVATDNLTPLCIVEEYNTVARNLVEKIGFNFICDSYWMWYHPAGAGVCN